MSLGTAEACRALGIEALRRLAVHIDEPCDHRINQSSPLFLHGETDASSTCSPASGGLIVETGRQFVLCGSSARKLKRGGGNLLGGRALRYELHPLVSSEIPEFDLVRALNHGLLPRHYLAERPRRRLGAYVGEYLREEIAAEAAVRNVPAFARFLEVAALTNGSLMSYENIARECGVSGPTVREWFQILSDTLIGHLLPAFRRQSKRRTIQAPKFWYFDVGIVNHLLGRHAVAPRTELFGRAFEHLIFQELRAHSHYSGLDYPISFWRTASQIEIDFVLGDGHVGIEVKGTHAVNSHHLRGLRAFVEEHRPGHAVAVSLDPNPRRLDDGIDVLPWRVFLDRLWAGELIT